MANFREAAESKGWTVQPDDTIFTVICYVADTDEEAVREARPHIEKFFSWMHRVPPQFLSPPGYVSRSEFLRRAQSAALADGTRATWDDMVSIGRIICGSPDTVADTLSHWAQEAQCSRMLMVLQHGDMPEWKAVKNMHMFAKEVIPRVQGAVEQRRGGQGPGGGEVAMASYREERFDLRGIETVVQIAGDGDPLVFLHGAGTVTGFDALLPLAERFKLIVPFHPGFGPSADDTTVDDIHDYRRHYLDLFDELGLEELALAGHSLGGWLAANFAADHTERVTRLVLAAPFGMRVEDHPTTDFLAIPGDQLPPYLTADMSIFEGHVPMPPTPEFLADRYRETHLGRAAHVDAPLRPQAAPLAAPPEDADAAPVGRRRPAHPRRAGGRVGRPHPRCRGQDAARRGPSHVRRESRGRRRARQLRGRGADGLTRRAPGCALCAHLCASWHGEGTVSTP